MWHNGKMLRVLNFSIFAGFSSRSAKNESANIFPVKKSLQFKHKEKRNRKRKTEESNIVNHSERQLASDVVRKFIKCCNVITVVLYYQTKLTRFTNVR